jgi:transposase-like protein
MSILTQAHFHNEAAAVARLEAITWPNGPVCQHCGGVDRITPVKGGRIGLRRCGDCKKQFTCKVRTVFEDSKVPLHKWFQAAHLLALSKNGTTKRGRNDSSRPPEMGPQRTTRAQTNSWGSWRSRLQSLGRARKP